MAQNIRNALQAMSNTAADTVSAPVDGIAWLLRKAGVNIPGNALMGSDWMRAQGLTAPVEPGAGQIVGDTLGLLAPMIAAAKAPGIARGLLSLDDKAMDMGRRAVENQLVRSGGIQPATVWHGSPHKFDAFDSSKIGSGEGAQAYGHGLYLAESPDVAKSYRAALSDFGLPDGAPEKGIATLISARGEEGERMARQAYKNLGPARLEEAIQKAKTHMDANSSLYKVDLPDEKIARMLDWDKPLSQQAPRLGLLSDSELYNLGITRNGADAFTGNPLTGADLMKFSDNQHGGGWLAKRGIPGLRYLDDGSRGTRQGTSNFVVFPGEENALRILERNGQPLR